MASPYQGLDKKLWAKKTEELIKKLPVTEHELVDVVLQAWKEILASSFGGDKRRYKIGKDILPTPQVLGALLHAVIPLVLEDKKPGKWRADKIKSEKDLVCIDDKLLSIEIKTSSSRTKIAGNRSVSQAQANPDNKRAIKEKSGYFLTVNFEKFSINSKTKKVNNPSIVQIALGWIDHADWQGQAAATGQSAAIGADIYAHKLKKIYPKDKEV